MERLVTRIGNEPAVPTEIDIDFVFGLDKRTFDGLQRIFNQLCDLTDILGDEYDLDRLRELVEADRKVRVVVLPCKVGDTVYQADTERVYDMEVKKIIYDCGHLAFDDNAIGKTVFLTREAAEAALKGEQNG